MSFRDEGGLPVRDCAGSPNNPASKCPKLSATDVTAKTIFEHFVFGSRTAPICALYHHSLCIHTPTAHSAAISRFSAFSSKKVPRVAPQFLCQQVIWPIPSTLGGWGGGSGTTDQRTKRTDTYTTHRYKRQARQKRQAGNMARGGC